MDNPFSPLQKHTRLLLFALSFVVVAFGQPASVAWLSAIAAIVGYVGILRFLIDTETAKKRFWLGTLWFTLVQGVQLSWTLYHPYSYIYFVYFAFSILCGFQFGAFSTLVTAKNVLSLHKVIALAALWTLFEWSRFFFLSGYSWNPIGLALTENIYSLQLASMGGIFALSYWVMLVNLLSLRAWFTLPKKRALLATACAAMMPYLFGIFHLSHHTQKMEESQSSEQEPFRALLVQTAFPAEEAIPFADKQSYISFVLHEWELILDIVRPHIGKALDLIALPEYVVPFGTYTFLYPYSEVAKAIETAFGASALEKLPPLELPFAREYTTSYGDVWFVNNAYWSQAIANVFDTELIVGLEDADNLEDGTRQHFSAAIHFKPNASVETFSPQRYAKRVLLPMAEYIPFTLLHSLASKYGIQGSFTCGSEATVFKNQKAPFGVSICYEETFGNIMRECRNRGAELLVNLTSDVWYPNSNLPKQHFDHARLRSIENGMPLLRACNTGLTTAIDSLGQVVATLGDTSPESQWVADALYVETPRYHYNTLYSSFGDAPIIIFCWLALLLFLL